MMSSKLPMDERSHLIELTAHALHARQAPGQQKRRSQPCRVQLAGQPASDPGLYPDGRPCLHEGHNLLLSTLPHIVGQGLSSKADSQPDAWTNCICSNAQAALSNLCLAWVRTWAQSLNGMMQLAASLDSGYQVMIEVRHSET